MTRFANDTSRFRPDMLAGFVSAYDRYVEKVPDVSGVVAAGGARVGKVATLIGGGSGHYPAFCGLVGEGLADGAVVGDVFTSPSAEQVYRTACAVDGGAGVLLSFGNYAGDVLNFGVAERRLRAEGVDARTVLVTDDVASAPAEQAGARRGIAGGLVVYKAAGAAAGRGASLAEVERVARRVNERTRSFGVAFAGCHLPGQASPLFEVPDGYVEVGLGIHGEPGVRTVEAMTVAELASCLVDPLLAEYPPTADGRVAALLNGLGNTKYEELFVLWQALRRLFDKADLQLVAPEVGEFVTSLDMAGCSLTLTWLDDELATFWTDPADTPAFRRPGPSPFVTFPVRRNRVPDSLVVPDRPSSEASTQAAQAARAALTAMLQAVQANQEELGRLDAIAGDGDHGIGMVRGLQAACDAAARCAGGLGSVLQAAGRAFADRAGGTSGVLWGVLLEVTGETLGDQRNPSEGKLVDALAGAVAEVRRLGGAEVGDKSLVDVAVPFVESLRRGVRAGVGLPTAWADAAETASEAAADTARLSPRIGRARPLAERSVGHADAGATSLALCLRAAGRSFQQAEGIVDG